MLDLRIRKMELSDIEKIDKAFTNQGWEKRTDVLTNYLTEQAEGKREVLIAAENEEVVGYLTILPLAKEGPFKNKFPEIVDFNVFTAFQNRGVGRSLLSVAEARVMNETNILTLGVGLHSGYGVAQRLYVKMGYCPDGSGVWYNDKLLKQGESCTNGDNLVLYLMKQLAE